MPMNSYYRIVVVEDEPIIAQDIKGCLEEFGHTVVGVFSRSNDAKNFLSRHQADLAILDVNLGNDSDGIELGKWILTHCCIPFLYLTSHADADTLSRAKDTYPSAYILKPFMSMDIQVAVEIAMNNFRKSGTLGLPAKTLESMNKTLPTPLSTREIDLLRKLEEGYTNRQIAQKMYISENTVKTHLKHIFEKLDVRNRTEALYKIRMLLSG